MFVWTGIFLPQNCATRKKGLKNTEIKYAISGQIGWETLIGSTKMLRRTILDPCFSHDQLYVKC